MGVNKPYRRTCRQFVNGNYFRQEVFLIHPKYAKSPQHFVRAFLILQNDLHKIFEYIEPADDNLGCYSFRIHELFFRACVEVEANCRAILKENGYSEGNINYWNMNDYKKIERSHRLSSYTVRLPVWDGTKDVRKPFEPWSQNDSLTWYEAYNSTKHDRHSTFEKASFENMIDAISGLIVLLSSQFLDEEYEYETPVMGLNRKAICDNWNLTIGSYFQIKYPDDWPEEERYDFNWNEINKEDDPFQNFPY